MDSASGKEQDEVEPWTTINAALDYQRADRMVRATAIAERLLVLLGMAAQVSGEMRGKMAELIYSALMQELMHASLEELPGNGSGRITARGIMPPGTKGGSMVEVTLQVTFGEDITQQEAERRVEEAFQTAEIEPTWDDLSIVRYAPGTLVAFASKRTI